MPRRCCGPRACCSRMRMARRLQRSPADSRSFRLSSEATSGRRAASPSQSGLRPRKKVEEGAGDADILARAFPEAPPDAQIMRLGRLQNLLAIMPQQGDGYREAIIHHDRAFGPEADDRIRIKRIGAGALARQRANLQRFLAQSSSAIIAAARRMKPARSESASCFRASKRARQSTKARARRRSSTVQVMPLRRAMRSASRWKVSRTKDNRRAAWTDRPPFQVPAGAPWSWLEYRRWCRRLARMHSALPSLRGAKRRSNPLGGTGGLNGLTWRWIAASATPPRNDDGFAIGWLRIA